MRHRVKGRKLKRTSSHRLATLRSLAASLLKHKKIKTTVAKAKELKKFIEPLVTKAKNDTIHARRLVSAEINDRKIVSELFGDIVTKIGDRPGGYTRVVRLGQRKGDAAEMAIIELVDFSGIVKPKTPKKGKEETVVSKEESKTEEKTEEKPTKKAAAKPKKEKKEKTENAEVKVSKTKTDKKSKEK